MAKTLAKKLMRRFQHAAGEFIAEVKRCALFIDMGLGKTVSVLTILRALSDDFEIGRILIVGPPRVVRSTWPDEIRLWEHTRNFTFTNIDGTPQRRMRRMTEATEIHLISRDNLYWLDSLVGDDHDYDVIVIDESSSFKTDSTKRFKAAARMVKRARYVILLTGTPAANGLHDLWAQMFLLDRGKRLGHTITDFRNRWFETNYGESSYQPTDWAEQQIKDQIEDICFTLRDADYAELPPRIDNIVKIQLDDDVMKQYKRFRRTLILELEDGANIKAINGAALTTKLLQLANGVVYDKDRKANFFHKAKIEALKEIVEEANGHSVFVAYSFITDITALKEAFPHAVVMTGKNDVQVIKDWNAGLIQMLIAHPKSAGHGLNLQDGGSIAVWYGLTWSLEDYQQFNKRLHRKGQTKTTVIHHLICEGTIDEDVMASLQGKDEVQSSLLNALRRQIRDELEVNP